jgi:hypothetical protein
VTKGINGNTPNEVVGNRTQHLCPQPLSCVIELDDKNIRFADRNLAMN